jgi:hypothetical protein
MQVGAFSVLKELVVVLPNCLADHIGSLIPGIEKALNVSNIRKIFFSFFSHTVSPIALYFVNILLFRTNHPPQI